MDRREFLRAAPAAAWGLTMPDLLSVMHQRLKVLEREVASLRRGRRATDWATGLGNPLFTEDDGLLLFGPYCKIASTEWWSLRRQMATLSGASQRVVGRWMATSALQVHLAATNLVLNPTFEVNVTDFWTRDNWETDERSATHARFGGYSFRGYESALGGAEQLHHYPVTVLATTDYTLSAWIKKTIATGPGKMQINWHNAGDGFIRQDALELDSGTHDWKRYELAVESPALAAKARIYAFYSGGMGVGTELEVFIDGVQFEKSAYATPYLDGSFGAGFAWTGAVHNSTSTRTKTEVKLDALVGLISGNNTLSFRCVVQMPYDHDAEWPVGRYLLDARGADSDSRILLRYDTATDEFILYINGDWRIENGAAQTFDAGDWLDLVVTIDFTEDEYYTYVNGRRDGDDTTSLAAPTLTQWNIGSDYLGASQTGFTFSEFAVFDRVLTPTEVAGLYALGQPLWDLAAVDTPTLVIGAVTLDADGVQVESTKWGTGGNPNQFRFRYDDAGTRKTIALVKAEFYDEADKIGWFWLQAQRVAGDPWTDSAKITLIAVDTVDTKDVRLNIDSDGAVDVTGSTHFEANAKIIAGTSIAAGTTIETTAGNKWKLAGVDAGTITPDSKINIEIDGVWYQLAGVDMT